MYSLKKVFDKREEGNLHHKNLRQNIHNKNRNINENNQVSLQNPTNEVKLTEAHIKRLNDLEIWRENRRKLKELERKNKKKVFHNVVRSHSNKYQSEFEYNSSEFKPPKGVRSFNDIEKNMNKTTTSFLFPKKINYLTHSSKKSLKNSTETPNDQQKQTKTLKTPVCVQKKPNSLNIPKTNNSIVSSVNKTKLQPITSNSTFNSKKDNIKLVRPLINDKHMENSLISSNKKKNAITIPSKTPLNGSLSKNKHVGDSLQNSTLNITKQTINDSMNNKENIDESIHQNNNLMTSPIQMITRSKLKILKEWAMTPEKSPFPKILNRLNSNQNPMSKDTNGHSILTPLNKKCELMKILQEWDDD